MRLIGVGLGAALLLGLVAGCRMDDGPTPAPTVIVNTPPSDGGMTVLLTVVIIVAFLALVGAVAFACCWNNERARRRAAEQDLRTAEDTVLGLTGHPVARARLGLGQRSAATDFDLGTGTGVERWRA